MGEGYSISPSLLELFVPWINSIVIVDQNGGHLRCGYEGPAAPALSTDRSAGAHQRGRS